jgi:hypothetical protein
MDIAGAGLPVGDGELVYRLALAILEIASTTLISTRQAVNTCALANQFISSFIDLSTNRSHVYKRRYQCTAGEVDHVAGA